MLLRCWKETLALLRIREMTSWNDLLKWLLETTSWNDLLKWPLEMTSWNCVLKLRLSSHSFGDCLAHFAYHSPAATTEQSSTHTTRVVTPTSRPPSVLTVDITFILRSPLIYICISNFWICINWWIGGFICLNNSHLSRCIWDVDVRDAIYKYWLLVSSFLLSTCDIYAFIFIVYICIHGNTFAGCA